jgi:hypothetical protein
MHGESIVIEIPIGSSHPSVRQRMCLTLCGSNCLLNEHANFVFATPVHSRRASGFLFKTRNNTLIKKRKHFGNMSHRLAFHLIRERRPDGVVAPLRECRCSYEMPFVNGQAVLQSVRSFRRICIDDYQNLNRTEALLFLRKARSTLLGLHRLGIVHGDPGAQNFLRSECEVSLIDLDDVHYTGKLGSGWEMRKFLLRTAIPVLKGYGGAGDLTTVLTFRDLGAFAVGAVAHFFWRFRRLCTVFRDRACLYFSDRSVDRTPRGAGYD